MLNLRTIFFLAILILLLIDSSLSKRFEINSRASADEVEEHEHHLKDKDDDSKKSHSSISVQGSATTSYKPDELSISFSIVTLQLTASSSLEENKQILHNVVGSLQLLGLNNEELGTTGFNLSPFYEYKYYKNGTNENVFKGYQVSNTLLIQTKKLDQAGNFIDAAVKSGVKNVNSVNFKISDSIVKKLQDEMIESAVKDALQKAILALNPLKAKVGGIKSINLNQGAPLRVNPAPFMAKTMIAGDAMERTSLYASKQDISAHVNVEFFIEY